MGTYRISLSLMLLAAAAALPPTATHGHEVDHFTVPVGRSMADVGPLYTQTVYGYLAAAVENTNRQLDRPVAAWERTRLLSSDFIAQKVNLSFPLFVTYIEELEGYFHSPAVKAQFPGLLTAWKAPESIYDDAYPPWSPHNFYLAWRSSVIRIGDHYLGTDKLGHFVHNGYNYYVAYRNTRKRGEDHEAALHAAVQLGAGDHPYFSEYTALGLWSSGVMSNADLAANYLGLKFYLNLTEPVVVHGTSFPPMLERIDGRWRLADHVRPDSNFFTRFFSRHVDEVFNANRYKPVCRAPVSAAIAERCAQLAAWYVDANGQPLTSRDWSDIAADMRECDGDYGYLGESAGALAYLHVCGETGGHGTPDSRFAAPADTAGQHVFDLDARDARKATPLHWAVGDPTAVRAILAAGGQVESVDALQRTPLHWAARIGAIGCAAELIARDADPNARDLDGETPLHHAARCGNTEMLRLLVNAGADVNAVALYGTTPLHLAAVQNHAESARLLVFAGADRTAHDALGRPAWKSPRTPTAPTAMVRKSK